jgi:hypothetical protein
MPFRLFFSPAIRLICIDFTALPSEIPTKDSAFSSVSFSLIDLQQQLLNGKP